MSACWRALAQQPDISIHVLAYKPPSGSFDTNLLAHVPHTLLEEGERGDASALSRIVRDTQPDVVVVPGWMNPAYLRVINESKLSELPVVMTMDTSYRGGFRQRLARYRLRSYFRRVSQVVVAGERAWQYARRLGFSEPQIHRGVYAYDDQLFDPIGEDRGHWPRRFLFVGRYVPEKGLATLIDAYARYRQHVSDPWPLTTCGAGPLKDHLASVQGVQDYGFVQPDKLSDVLANHGVFVLPSHYEPWGVVVAEACAAGLPIIVTEQVGASVEIVRSLYNGLVVPTADADRLTDAMTWFHQQADSLPTMGRHSHLSAKPYAARLWGLRWDGILQQAARVDYANIGNR